MAGHGTNKSGIKQSGGRRNGVETKGRAKPVPANIANKREAKARERKEKGSRR